MKAVNINWDVDKENDQASLPEEIAIPAGMEDEDEISDYLSDVTGFCHNGFGLVEDEAEIEHQKYASKKWATTAWHIDDVIYAAKRNNITLTPEQADEWWHRNEKAFHELLVEAGNAILEDMDFISDGIIHMVKTANHVDMSKVDKATCHIDCDYLLTKDQINSGVFPGLFADFCYGQNIPGKEEADTDTIFWIRFENDELPSKETLIKAYDEMLTFAKGTGEFFGVSVVADREAFLEDLKRAKEKED